MDEEDRKKVPKKHEIWIDIGVRSKAEALERVSIGDVATYDHELELFSGSIGTATQARSPKAVRSRGAF